MWQLRARAARMAGMRVVGWNEGWEPGMARSKGATRVLGWWWWTASSELLLGVEAGEKSLEGVLSWAWISMPTVRSQPGTVWLSDFFSFFLGEPEDLAALAWSLSCLRRGIIWGCWSEGVGGVVDRVRRGSIGGARGDGLRWRQPRRVNWPVRRYFLSSVVGNRAMVAVLTLASLKKVRGFIGMTLKLGCGFGGGPSSFPLLPRLAAKCSLLHNLHTFATI